MNPAESLHSSVGTFVSALVSAGVRHVSACPGSRSTPLAIELARAQGVKLWMHLDERSAGFFGLGLARATRTPVGLLATSGTAVANFMPAVVEASLSRVPLVVLTADRPHELRDNGAAQTMDQLHLYGSHTRWFFDLPEPDGTDAQLDLLATLAARAVAAATAEPNGPVHLNWPFRDPLIPAPGPLEPRPPVHVHHPRLAPSSALVQDVAATLVDAPRGVIVVGPQDDPSVPPAVTRLAARLDIPVLADALSGVRRGRHAHELVIDTYDAFLRDASTARDLAPDVVLRIGAIPTSKPLEQFVAAHATRTVVVDPGGWRDPSSLASDMLQVDPTLLCEALAEAVPPARAADDEWCTRWTRLNAAARRAMDAHLAGVDELFEGKVFASLAEVLPADAVVYAGNSMPVRDLDTFLPRSDQPLRCLSNRGANGIDGVVSSAFGASAGGGGPVVLLIGDVSFYHDLNGLLAARRHALDLLVVLLNNDGGGIFSFLPQADQVPDDFELLFGTPHGLDFQPFVEGYGGTFARVEDWTSFNGAIEAALGRGGLNVVEVPTERRRNVAQHRAVWRAVAEALSPTLVA